MNIITGKFKGRKLISLSTKNTRPTLNRIKESVFNIINDYIDNSVVLDLFAGSGALGIECISRGANMVYFNDSNPESENVILKNLKGDLTNAKILCVDYLDAISIIKDKFSLVFIDPPYASDMGEKAIWKLAKENKLKNGAILIFEHNDKKDLQTLPKGCIIEKIKVFGNKIIHFIKYEVNNGC